MSETVTPPERQHDQIEDDGAALTLPAQATRDDPPLAAGERWRFGNAVQAARALNR